MIAEISVDGVLWTLEHAGDYIGRHLAKGAFYEEDLLQSMKERGRAGAVAVDVGAHIGNHTVWLAGVCGMRVVALEPIGTNLQYLVRNVLANDLGGRVTVVQRAASDRARPLSVVKVDPDNTGATTLSRGGSAEVRAVTIDSLNLQEAAILKVDVEGMEFEALEGARQTLLRCKPVVYVETNHRAALDELMAGMGYVRFARFSKKNHYGYEVRS